MDRGQTDCYHASINLTLCLVLNLAIFCLELQSNFLARALQGNNTTLQEAIAAANLAKNRYTRLHTEAEFTKFYESCVSFSEGKSDEPVLPRYRRAPARLDDGAPPHRFECPEYYYKVEYYEACSKVKTQ